MCLKVCANKLKMWMDLSGWKPTCEQAKYLGQTFRIAGTGFVAVVGGHLVASYAIGDSSLYQRVLLALVVLDWFGFEFIGYLIVGKGGC